MNPERKWKVLVAPHFTEKASLAGDNANTYTFKVAVDATKLEIKQAVEGIFEVSVAKVTTINVKGKTKRTQRGVSKRNDWKKAYVRLAEGQDIELAEAP